jgi:hypothetical protein
VTTVPELRVAPDGRVAARTHRLGGPEWAVVAGPDASWLTQVRPTDAEFSSWTPLAPGREVERKLNQAIPLIDDLVDGEDCSLDHHGYCQTHHWFPSSECPQARAKRWLAGLDRTPTGGDKS